VLGVLRVFDEDRQLAQRLIGGDQQAFRAFFAQYAQLLAAFVLRRSNMDRAAAEDIVQNVMIRALRALPDYRAEASLLTWMCQICRSELADVRRRTARRPATVSMDSDASTAAAVGQLRGLAELEPERQAALGEHTGAVVRVLERLPERYTWALEWKYGEDMSVEEIGRQLGISATAAQSLLARARDAFRDAWLADHSREGAGHV
jgi:RNA polymerase sigma-70 factor, ECF subfamily